MDKKIRTLANHSEESEKVIEAYLVKKVREYGGICLKYSNPGMTGYPDRVILFPDGITVWVEVKSKGQRPKPIQEIRIREIRDLGHNVAVVSSKEEVDSLLQCTKFFHDIDTLEIEEL